MILSSWLLAVATIVGAQQATWRPVEVSSANAHFVARIRKPPAQAQVDDALARWRLEVFEVGLEVGEKPLWSDFVQHRPGERAYWVGDDGRVVAALEPVFHPSQPLLRLWREDQSASELSAGELGLERPSSARAGAGPWLAEQGAAPGLEWIETPRGPVQHLRLTTTGGQSRWIALDSGEVLDRPAIELPLSVEPPASRAEKPGLRCSTTRAFRSRRELPWGEVLQVQFDGSHPSPNWLFVGFEVRVGEPDGEGVRELLLSPIAAPPREGSFQAQVIVDFNSTARIQGLAPGAYRLTVEGTAGVLEPQRVDVGPARAAIELHRRGGVAGLEQSLRVYPGGIWVEDWQRPVREPAVRFGVARRERVERLRELVGRLETPSKVVGVGAVDAISCELTLFDRALPRTILFEEPGATGTLLELARELARVVD